MSIPETDKKTSNHQVYKVTYDTKKMHKLMLFNIILGLLLIGSVWYLTCKICSQNEQITMLSKKVIELNYKVDQQALHKNQQEKGQNNRLSEDEEFLEHIANHFDQAQQDIKKIKFHMKVAEDQISELKTELKTLVSMIKQQSKSSWQMKEVIDGINNKLEIVLKAIENIPNMFQNIPTPDFGAMKDRIKGTFENIKESMGNMFDSGDNQQRDFNGKKKDEGMFDGMKDRFQRGWRSYIKQAATKQKQL